MIDLNAIKAAAEAATPGPWQGDRYDGTVKYTLQSEDGSAVIRGDNGNSDAGPFGIMEERDEKYLMLAHPAAVLELIALTERLQSELTAERAAARPALVLPTGWRARLADLRDNTETFGQYSQETARVAIECCMNAMEELEDEQQAPADAGQAHALADAELPPLPASHAMGLYSAAQMYGYASKAQALRQPAQCAAPDERAAFEAWASDPVRAGKLPLDRWPGNDGYKGHSTYAAYYGWQARASLAAPTQPVAAQPSIDTPEFILKLDAWYLNSHNPAEAYANLITYIDLWGHGRYIRGYDKRKEEEKSAPPAPAAQPEAKAAPVGAPDAQADLHAAIMNLPCKTPDYSEINYGHYYRIGHRDARHAAAELVSGNKELREFCCMNHPDDHHDLTVNETHWSCLDCGDSWPLHPSKSAAAQPEQQPVAWHCVHSVTGRMLYTDSESEMVNMRDALAKHWKITPLVPADAPETLYTCIGKGGTYSSLGAAMPAGTMKGVLLEDLMIYRDTKTGQLYFRVVSDFFERMAAAPVGGA